MLLEIPRVLTAAQLEQCRQALEQADWMDGRATAGYLSTQVKRNQQLSENHPVAMRLGAMIMDSLEQNAAFMSGALPAKVVPPLFNRYGENETYGAHIDGAVRPIAGSSDRVRTDLSATLFLSNPGEYEGGELIIEDTYAVQKVKLAAGNMVLYPASSVHHVSPVTRGARLAAFFWIQSMVREDHRRRMLYGLDASIQALRRESPQSASILELTALYHNLLREWADV
ncbi:MAG: Fe2+-dependent dioxygenase [Proteobacteria bacterium]|nr:Fe2+-dependent dioxygenase [Pseudomonadota bacterium]